MITYLLDGFGFLFSTMAAPALLGGVVLGIILGVLPGLTATMGIAAAYSTYLLCLPQHRIVDVDWNIRRRNLRRIGLRHSVEDTGNSRSRCHSS